MSNFLLSIENVNPLIDLIKQVDDSVTNNHEVIKSLPDLSLNFETEKIDDLHNHIYNKYDLSNIPTDFHTSNSRLNTLLEDNYRLIIHKQRIQRRNYELFKILKEYQEFIIKELLPQLRFHHVTQSTKVLKDIKTLNLEKLKADNQLWEKYQGYIEKIGKIMEVSEYLNTSLEDLDNLDIEVKLESIDRLIKDLGYSL
ncbi:hypothetical protein CLIB1444_10S05248 [[Candida] jaroonii]|uniref:Uncharacterized protein n=1 Tax=[Candida] jaroonii TaxID=467808 RepID=A0ACA9YD18_9ASCO|nr:hypothetical protein CLIB1444_10S05248 [[Candida] jaroonii]